MSEKERQCETCKYNHYNGFSLTWLCTQEDSDEYMHHTKFIRGCDKWEEKDAKD